MKTDEIARQMLPVLGQDIVLCTDAYRGYNSVCKTAGINHVALNQNKGERTRGVYHIQNVNAYHSRLKGCTKYLNNYMTWFAYIDTTLIISGGVWDQRFLAMSLQVCRFLRNMRHLQRTHFESQGVGSLFFVTHDTGEREPDQLCHSHCYHSLGRAKT
jgi:hypothetical protein